MTTAFTRRSLANEDNDVTKSGALAGDMTELTESERDFRLKTACAAAAEGRHLECDEEEQRKLDELLTQCRDYIYSSSSSCHVTSSPRIITNGSLTSRTPSSPTAHRDGVMAACWLELPVSLSRDTFRFPVSDACVDSTSHRRDVCCKTLFNRALEMLLLTYLLARLNPWIRHSLIDWKIREWKTGLFGGSFMCGGVSERHNLLPLRRNQHSAKI